MLGGCQDSDSRQFGGTKPRERAFAGPNLIEEGEGAIGKQVLKQRVLYQAQGTLGSLRMI